MAKHKKLNLYIFYKLRKVIKKFPIALIIFCLVCLIFIGYFVFLNKTNQVASIYIFPENPKQGDTVFIKVNTQANQVTGNFSEQKLVFYKKNNLNEWIALLGIDADQTSGDYKIYVDTSNAEHLVKDLKISLADFSLAPITEAPSVVKDSFTKEIAVNNVRKNDNPFLKKVLSNFTAEPYFQESFAFPLVKMEKRGFPFGQFIGFAKNKLQHLGVDLRAPKKTEIYAVNDGRVVAIVNLSNYGKTIIIDHGLDIFSLYLHLDDFKIKEGDVVERGQAIGLSGDTGYSTAPHLHFSMRVGTARVDPIVFIETSKKIENEYSIMANINKAFENLTLSFRK